MTDRQPTAGAGGRLGALAWSEASDEPVVSLVPFRELAFLMSVGIMLDVLVVRTLLVTLLTLFGPISAWPSNGSTSHHASQAVDDRTQSAVPPDR